MNSQKCALWINWQLKFVLFLSGWLANVRSLRCTAIHPSHAWEIHSDILQNCHCLSKRFLKTLQVTICYHCYRKKINCLLGTWRHSILRLFETTILDKTWEAMIKSTEEPSPLGKVGSYRGRLSLSHLMWNAMPGIKQWNECRKLLPRKQYKHHGKVNISHKLIKLYKKTYYYFSINIHNIVYVNGVICFLDKVSLYSPK